MSSHERGALLDSNQGWGWTPGTRTVIEKLRFQAGRSPEAKLLLEIFIQAVRDVVRREKTSVGSKKKSEEMIEELESAYAYIHNPWHLEYIGIDGEWVKRILRQTGAEKEIKKKYDERMKALREWKNGKRCKQGNPGGECGRGSGDKAYA